MKGFTIVELLIVVVIIGILVALASVSYTAITSKAEFAAIQSDVKQKTQAIELFKIKNGTYPTSISACDGQDSSTLCLKTPENYSVNYKYFPVGTRSLGTGFSNTILSNAGFYELTIEGGHRFMYTSRGSLRGGSEFMQYTDLAPLIDRYGVKEYTLKGKIRSLDTTNSNIVNAYFQNGSDTRYTFGKALNVTTADEAFEFNFTPTDRSSTGVVRAMLAFYGTYDTGNIPVVSDIEFYLAQ